MKTVSIISIVYGTLGMIWAALVWLIIRIQSAMLGNFPWPEEVFDYVDMPELLNTLYSIIGSVFPFVFLIAILYIISGILQLGGRAAFKNIAYAAAILNIIWYLAYVIMVMSEMMPILNSIEIIPNTVMNVIMVFGMIMNAFFYCGYPVFLIIFISRGGRAWDTLDTGYSS